MDTPTAEQITQARKVQQAYLTLVNIPRSRRLGPERAARRVYREAGGILFEMCGGDHRLIDAAMNAARA